MWSARHSAHPLWGQSGHCRWKKKAQCGWSTAITWRTIHHPPAPLSLKPLIKDSLDSDTMTHSIFVCFPQRARGWRSSGRHNKKQEVRIACATFISSIKNREKTRYQSSEIKEGKQRTDFTQWVHSSNSCGKQERVSPVAHLVWLTLFATISH